MHMYMNDESLGQGKAKQLRLKTTPLFSREKEELPQAGFEPATFCVLGRCYAYMYIYYVHILCTYTYALYMYMLTYLCGVSIPQSSVVDNFQLSRKEDLVRRRRRRRW